MYLFAAMLQGFRAVFFHNVYVNMSDAEMILSVILFYVIFKSTRHIRRKGRLDVRDFLDPGMTYRARDGSLAVFTGNRSVVPALPASRPRPGMARATTL